MQKVRLGEVCKLNMGQSPDSSSYNENKEGIPFFQGNADFGEVYPNLRVWCRCPIKTAKIGDILISVRAPIGALNMANMECCIGRGLAALTVNEKICNKKYFWYCIKSQVEELKSKGTGSTFKAISKEALSETILPIYPLEQQQQIVSVLDKISLLIDKRKKQLKKLDELVKSRFIEMFGDPVENPMNWPMAKMGDYLKFLTSGSRGWAKYYSDDGELFITIKNVKDGKISIDNVQHVQPPTGAEAERTRVQEGDLLISITADLGRTGIVTRDIVNQGAYINQHLSCIRLDRKSVEPLFVALYLESSAGKAQFERKNQSAVKAGLNFAAIRSLQFPLPPLALQQEFAAFVEKVDKLAFKAKASLEKLETLKKALMQKYFN